MSCLVNTYDRLRAWCNPAAIAYGAPLLPPAPWMPPMPSAFYTQPSLVEMQQWRTTHNDAPPMGIYAARPHTWSFYAFSFFYLLVIPLNVTCIILWPTHQLHINKGFALLAMIVVTVCILRSLRRLLLPWKTTVMAATGSAFGLPFWLWPVSARKWLCFGTAVSAASVWSKVTGWGAIALDISSPENWVRWLAWALLFSGIIMPIKQVFFSYPASRTHDGERQPPLVTQEITHNPNGRERYFCTYAELRGLSPGGWCSTDYECYINYGSTLGNWFANKMIVELELAKIAMDYRQHGFYAEGQFTMQQSLLQSSLRKAKLILMNKLDATITTLCSTMPKLIAQVVAFHCTGSDPNFGMVVGFLSFVLSNIFSYPSLKHIFFEVFLRVRREWEARDRTVPYLDRYGDDITADYDQELASANKFFKIVIFGEFFHFCLFVCLAFQAIHDSFGTQYSCSSS